MSLARKNYWGHYFLRLLLETRPPFLRGHPSHWKRLPSFLSHFKTLSTGPAPGIEPATSSSTVKRSTDWANPPAVNKPAFVLLLACVAFVFPREFVSRRLEREQKRGTVDLHFTDTCLIRTPRYDGQFSFFLWESPYSLSKFNRLIRRPVNVDNGHLFLAQSTNGLRKLASLIKDCIFFTLLTSRAGGGRYSLI